MTNQHHSYQSEPRFDRRRFVARSAAAGRGSRIGEAAGVGSWEAVAVAASSAEATHQAMGTRVGEVTDTSAIVWTRLTVRSARNADGQSFVGKVRRKDELPVIDHANSLLAACPGASGRLRVRYSYILHKVLVDARETPWVDVSAASDFSHQFQLSGLSPATTYYYEVESAGPEGQPSHAPWRGKFETAPAAGQTADIRFSASPLV